MQKAYEATRDIASHANKKQVLQTSIESKDAAIGREKKSKNNYHAMMKKINTINSKRVAQVKIK